MEQHTGMVDLAGEIDMLRFKLCRLQGLGIVLAPFEEARMLQSECELLERMVVKSWKRAPNVLQDLKYFLHEANSPWGIAPPEHYAQWISAHMKYHDETLRYSDYYVQNTSMRCSEADCIHYIYGFGTVNELKLHLNEYHQHIQHQAAAPSYSEPYPQSIGQELPIEPIINTTEEEITCDSPGNHDSSSSSATLFSFPETPQFVQISFDANLVAQSCYDGPSPHRKRLKKNRTRLSTKVTPCLRCKVLKKQCDDETYCSNCPRKKELATGDHWKVIGCYRGPIEELLKMFLQGHTSSLNSDQVPSPEFWSEWLSYELKTIWPARTAFLAFTAKYDGSFHHDCIALLQKVCPATSSRSLTNQKQSQPPHTDTLISQSLAPMWALFSFSCLYMQKSASKKPALALDFDLAWLLQCDEDLSSRPVPELRALSLAFTLFRLSKSNVEPHAELHPQSHAKSHATPHSEAQIPSEIFSKSDGGEWNGFGRRVRAQMEAELEICLKAVFTPTRLRRKCLLPDEWICGFRALCVLGVVQSVVIAIEQRSCKGSCENADVARNRNKNKTVDVVVTRIESAYKTLVSVFCWAGKGDPLAVDWTSMSDTDDNAKNVNFNNNLKNAGANEREDWGEWAEDDRRRIQDIQDVVDYETWKERGIRGTRGFLMGLVDSEVD